MDSSRPKEIITVPSLQTYFFDVLSDLNKKATCPIPQEIIYYSSDVLNKFALSHEYYDSREGKVREKILGTKLLEATQVSREEQKRIYKDVGDTALFLCGYFAESTQKKLVDANYYSQLGRSAYQNLNGVVPKFFDIPFFYSMLSTSFGPLVSLISKVASLDRFGEERYLGFRKILLTGEEMTPEEHISSGVIPNFEKKVS
ncbi:MAG: hypothetical protein ACOVP4_05855 [Bacteriovoracaceae bacterium]|jgi:hypothetical protein